MAGKLYISDLEESALPEVDFRLWRPVKSYATRLGGENISDDRWDGKDATEVCQLTFCVAVYRSRSIWC